MVTPAANDNSYQRRRFQDLDESSSTIMSAPIPQAKKTMQPTFAATLLDLTTRASQGLGSEIDGSARGRETPPARVSRADSTRTIVCPKEMRFLNALPPPPLRSNTTGSMQLLAREILDAKDPDQWRKLREELAKGGVKTHRGLGETLNAALEKRVMAMRKGEERSDEQELTDLNMICEQEKGDNDDGSQDWMSISSLESERIEPSTKRSPLRQSVLGMRWKDDVALTDMNSPKSQKGRSRQSVVEEISLPSLFPDNDGTDVLDILGQAQRLLENSFNRH